jgi:hypothetical protein
MAFLINGTGSRIIQQGYIDPHMQIIQGYYYKFTRLDIRMIHAWIDLDIIMRKWTCDLHMIFNTDDLHMIFNTCDLHMIFNTDDLHMIFNTDDSHMIFNTDDLHMISLNCSNWESK